MEPLEQPPATEEGDDSEVATPDDVPEIVAVVDIQDAPDLDEDDYTDDT
jgi:hypothetical protein